MKFYIDEKQCQYINENLMYRDIMTILAMYRLANIDGVVESNMNDLMATSGINSLSVSRAVKTLIKLNIVSDELVGHSTHGYIHRFKIKDGWGLS